MKVDSIKRIALTALLAVTLGLAAAPQSQAANLSAATTVSPVAGKDGNETHGRGKDGNETHGRGKDGNETHG